MLANKKYFLAKYYFDVKKIKFVTKSTDKLRKN